MSVTYKVYAGGSHLRDFRSEKSADAYCTDVVAQSNPNIGEVELFKVIESDHYDEFSLVRSYGVPKKKHAETCQASGDFTAAYANHDFDVCDCGFFASTPKE